MHDEAKRRNRSTRYGLLVEAARLPEELHSVRDCTEEALLVMADAFRANATTSDLTQIRNRGGALYDRVEAIILRAQSLSADPGSSPQTGQPSQLP